MDMCCLCLVYIAHLECTNAIFKIGEFLPIFFWANFCLFLIFEFACGYAQSLFCVYCPS